MAANRKPDFIIKHDIRNSEGKTVRSVRIGAMWAPADGKPGFLAIDYTPVTWDGRATVWPFTERPTED